MNNNRESLNSSGSWFPNAQQMTDLAKTGGVVTMPTASDPQKHLEDVKQGKVTNFSKTSKSKG
jgi:hypothetical protein